MKKKKNLIKFGFCDFCLFLVVLCSVFLMVSCNNFAFRLFRNTDFSESDANYALRKALSSSIQRAAIRLDTALETMDYIPEKYSVLKENDDIPGIISLTSYVEKYYSEYIRENISYFSVDLMMLADTFVFKNPKEKVSESNISASTAFLELYRNTILLKFKKIMEEADNSYFSDIVSQYNAYVITENNAVMEKTRLTLLEKENISDYIAERVCELFFNLLLESEELFRTTPDPYVDKTVGRVFGIR